MCAEMNTSLSRVGLFQVPTFIWDQKAGYFG